MQIGWHAEAYDMRGRSMPTEGRERPGTMAEGVWSLAAGCPGKGKVSRIRACLPQEPLAPTKME